MKGIFQYLSYSVIWLILFLIIRNNQVGFVSDFFNLSNFSKETTNDYFKLIGSATATMFAILIAVITFGYELLGKSSRRRKRFNILNKWQLTAYSSLAVAIILISFYSAFTIHSLQHTKDLTTAYFVGITFISFIFLLFIFTIWLLSLSDTISEVKKMIIQSKEIDGYSDDIINELIYYIQEHDTDAFGKNILPQLNQHSLFLIGNAENRKRTNDILNSLIKVWETGNTEALRVGEQQYFNSIWSNIESIYKHAADNDALLLHYQPLEDFIRQQIEFLSVNNCISGLTNGVKKLSEIYLYQLQNNCPQEETINDLYWAYKNENAPNSTINTDLQWDHINGFLSEIGQIQKIAVDLKSKYLFEEAKFALNIILFDLRYSLSLKLGVYQEAFITNEIYSLQIYSALMALENKMYKNSADAYNFNDFAVAEYIKNEKIFSNAILKLVEEYILICQKNNQLDDIITVNDLGGLGRVISIEYQNNKTVQSEFLTIVEILYKLKIEIQKEAKFNENKNYIEIKRELESLKSYLGKVNDSSITNKVVARIDEILNSF